MQAITVADAHEGMAASLRAGVAWAHGAPGLMVMLPDMPGIGTGDLAALLAAFDADPTRPVRAAAEDGTEGHPVIFPRRLYGELAVLTGDVGGRALLQGEDVRAVIRPGQRAICDLDTPEDWESWRRGGA